MLMLMLRHVASFRLLPFQLLLLVLLEAQLVQLLLTLQVVQVAPLRQLLLLLPLAVPLHRLFPLDWVPPRRVDLGPAVVGAVGSRQDLGRGASGADGTTQELRIRVD